MKKDKVIVEFVDCECGYHNQPKNVKRYGTCTGCGRVLDKKAKFEYEMYCKLNLWRYKKNRRGL